MTIDYRAKAAEMVGKRTDLDISCKAVSIDSEKHQATFVMSTEAIDRHGDIVEQDSWKLEHFLKNPAFFWGHRSNDFPLGKWIDIRLEADPEMPGKKMLVGTAEFAVEVHPDIQRAWDHVVRGDLNMVSVGFIPHVVDYDEKADAFVLKSCELIECSLVGIGSNRRAMVKSEDPVDKLLDAKKEIEESLPPASDLEGIRKRNAILMIHKAVRQLQK